MENAPGSATGSASFRRKVPVSLSARTSTPDQESNSWFAASRKCSARSYRWSCARNPPRRKFAPVNASQDVTTFQAARPPERWSRLENCRATSYGSLNVELMVPVRPSRCDRGQRGQHGERVGPADHVQVVDLTPLFAQ